MTTNYLTIKASMPRTTIITPEKFATFGELLRFLRRKADLTQRELSIAVGYSESQISRLEQNERAPEEATLAARFVPALYIEDELQWVARLLELGVATRAHAPNADAPQPIAEARSTPHNLPIQLTSFIGREKEITEINRLLSEGEGSVRLLTLTGHGGCGKTRLALQSASGLLDDFRDGVWLIELAPLADPALVPQTVAAVLGLKEEPGRAIQSILADHLRGKRILLILDNCEHLVQASAQFADVLLHACPEVHILVTSREMLGVSGERALVVPSLSMPDPHESPSVELLNQYEAVKLFAERARTVMPGFTLTDENSIAITQICQRLDGIPLALELAAARLRMLPVEQIAARLNDSFRLLTGGSRTVLPRHQTLQALIDWSYELLTPTEQVVFRRLAVFAGGWTLEAAEAVCIGEGIKTDEVFDLLAHLLDKSLVLAEEHGKTARYRMLETIRQYALAKLAASGEADEVRQRHMFCVFGMAQTGNPFLSWANSTPKFQLSRWESVQTWHNLMEMEHDNLRAALAWSQSAPGNAELGLQLTALLFNFWRTRGYRSEACMWYKSALAPKEVVNYPQARAEAMADLGSTLMSLGDYAAGQAQLTDSLTIFHEIGNLRASAGVLHDLGLLAREKGDMATARLRLEDSLAISRKLGDQAYLPGQLNTLGEVLVLQEDAEGATRLLEESLALSQEAGYPNETGWALNHLGHVAQLQGEYERATRLHQESLPFFREVGLNWVGIPWAHQGLGETALAQSDAALAATHLAEALRLFSDLGDRAGVSWCLAGLAGVSAVNEDPERAAWLWGAAEKLRKSIGAREAPASHTTHERLKAEVRAQLGEAIFNAKWAEGQAASVEQAIAEAIE
jgi:predicted ATPase/DNA-binding XRE family transcriptional regulator